MSAAHWRLESSPQSHQPGLSLFVVELASACWSLPSPRPPKSGSPWECVLPRGWLLTSAERCRRVNIPAPLSSDWDNSRAAKAPCGNDPTFLSVRLHLMSSPHVTFFSSLPHSQPTIDSPWKLFLTSHFHVNICARVYFWGIQPMAALQEDWRHGPWLLVASSLSWALIQAGSSVGSCKMSAADPTNL